MNYMAKGLGTLCVCALGIAVTFSTNGLTAGGWVAICFILVFVWGS